MALFQKMRFNQIKTLWKSSTLPIQNNKKNQSHAWAHNFTLYVKISWQNNKFLSVQYYKNTQRSFTKYTHTLVSGQNALREEATVKQRCIKQILNILLDSSILFSSSDIEKNPPHHILHTSSGKWSFHKTILHRQPCLQSLKYNTFGLKKV